MRYSEDHKAKTHQRIIEEAARLFRQKGVGATGLQPLMKTLGLTHGGFYAHFKSKDELVETALRYSADQAGTSFFKDAPLAEYIHSYLSATHREDAGTGCPLTTLSVELGQRGTPSPVTDEMIDKRLQAIEKRLDCDNADEQSVLMLCAMVGALMLSRSVNDKGLSDRLLQTTRDALMEQIEEAQYA
ncbi:TetR/AcrR family transcriptional regulator [Pseudomonas sp. LRF_L74]|uniref:TetR/AcrR family transcriptional regulator n=1 Tax=Pseudomonas sp. LRF_L74 TaxID=3369422 RepID=UPI003F5FE438